MRNAFIIIFILIGFIANSKMKSNQTKYDKNKCFELLERIIKTSQYDVIFNKKHKNKIEYVIYIDEATKNKITIQILLKSKTDQNVPLGWLELDLIKNQLRDITNDLDKPILMKFDANLYKQFKSNCLKYCLD